MENLNKIFKTLGDDTRFKIVRLLLQHDLCVGAIANHLEISKAAVSQHLQILRKVGLVKGEKRGYWTHYLVERNVLKQVAQELTDLSNQPACSEIGCIGIPLDEKQHARKKGERNV